MKTIVQHETRALSTAPEHYHQVLQQIYIAYFGRPADTGGLAYFANRYLEAQAPTTISGVAQAYYSNGQVKALIDSFGASQESRDLYPGDNGQFITAVYRNLFNREPDAAGKSYWKDLLDTGVMTRANAALSIMGGAQSNDIIIIANKTAAATSFTSATHNALQQMAYSGLQANAVVRTAMSSIGETTTAPQAAETLKQTLATLVSSMSSHWRFTSPTGSDNNPGSFEQPYRTIQKCASTVASGWSCQLRAGTYRETVQPNSGVTITAFGTEVVTVDGTEAIASWTRHNGAIYRTQIELRTDGSNQLFVDNDMMTEARWPNGDDLFHVNWAVADKGTDAARLVDPNMPKLDWTGSKIHLWSGDDPWSPQTGEVTAGTSGDLTIKLHSAPFFNFIKPTPGGYYYLFGSLAALDKEREWVYDAATKTLYFYAPGGVDPATLNVRVKRRDFAFDLSNRTGVAVKGLNLFASTITTNTSSQRNVIDTVHARYLSHFTLLLEDHPTQTGSSWYHRSTDTGFVINGDNNTIKNSTIEYSSGSGIALNSNGNIVENNLIHHIDYVGNYGAGVVVQGRSNTIRMNTIHTTARFSIFPNYKYDSVLGRMVAPDYTEIAYNNLYAAMVRSRDGAAIYAGGVPAAVGARIHHNWIHDVQTRQPGAADTYSMAGIYMDENSAGWQIEQNVLWNNQTYNIFIHGSSSGGKDPVSNNIINNSIPDTSPTAYIYVQDVFDCGTTQIINNQVLVPVKHEYFQLPLSTKNCFTSNNSISAPGAFEMNDAGLVGCNFSGCSSAAPPKMINGALTPSIAVQPRSVTIDNSSSAILSVRAFGGGVLQYQWQREGVNIAGATGSTLTLQAVDRTYHGAKFTVTVRNLQGTANSEAAILTVR